MVVEVFFSSPMCLSLSAGYRFRYLCEKSFVRSLACCSILCWVSFSIPKFVSIPSFQIMHNSFVLGKITQLNLIDSLSRLQMEAKAIEMAIKPTAEQKKRLRSFISAVGGNVDIDFMDENYNTTHSVSYEGVSPARVLSGITSFYDEGIKPKGNVSYSLAIEDRDIKPIGEGAFGPIYDQFKGKPQEAIEFLLAIKRGEAIGALYHNDIGEIDLVWGYEGTGHSDGFGLSKLAKFHPEVLGNLQQILNDMQVVSRNSNRVNLESSRYKAAVRLTWDNQSKKWLLTAFEKRNSAIDNTTDTIETAINGKQNDTTTLQSTISADKDTASVPKNQISEQESFSLNRDTTFATPEMVAEANEELSREAMLLAQLDEAPSALPALLRVSFSIPMAVGVLSL